MRRPTVVYITDQGWKGIVWLHAHSGIEAGLYYYLRLWMFNENTMNSATAGEYNIAWYYATVEVDRKVEVPS